MDYTNKITEWNYKEEDISKQYLFFNILKTGQIHVLAPNTPDTDKIPPSDDVTTGGVSAPPRARPDHASSSPSRTRDGQEGD